MSVPPTTSRVSTRTVWPVAIIGLIVLGALAFYLSSLNRPKSVTVVRRDIISYVPLKGQAITPPSAYAEAHATYAGTVDKVETTLGATVQKGDVLVELANPSGNETYEQARQNVRAAETAYANAKNQYDQQVKAAEQQLEAARTAAKASSAPPTDAMPNSNAETDTTEPAPPEAAPAAPAMTTTPLDVATAEQALQQAKMDRETGLQSYRQQLDQAREAYRQARAGKDMTRIHAPISGTVITLNAQPGQTVGQNNAPVAVIVDRGALQVQAPLTPEQAGVVKPEMPVTLTFDTVANKQFEGKVQRITTQADPASATGVIKGAQYVALLSFKNSEGLVKPDAAASVSVQAGAAKDVLAVPVEAIQRDQTGKPIVNVLDNGEWEPVVVETGLSDGRYTEIESGLKEGQTVQAVRSLAQTVAP
jgi:multidrug efflux pump subunit AcrA (membrane-fusion protein)